MSLVSITRLKPCDLQEIQVQANVGANGAISDVIKSLQYNQGVVVGNGLNTSCPTCVKNDAPTGFVQTTFNGNTFNVICPTCKGYLLYYTQGGGLTPPSNPFNARLVVTRLLPADLYEASTGFSTSTLSTTITALQANFAIPPSNACPQCANGAEGVSTGWLTSPKRFCPCCNGMQLTIYQYTMVNGIATRYIPTINPPNPLPIPPNP